MKYKLKYIYGPVNSWRLGSSLGVDLLSQKDKICNFDCVYCQLGRGINYAAERKDYVAVENVVEELKTLPDMEIDYITFSGRGESALAANIGKVIRAVKALRLERVAILTNSSLLGLKEVRDDIVLADFVVAKLDAYSSDSLRQINNPAGGIEFDAIIGGIRQFRRDYRGKLALQIMFIENNKQVIDKYIYWVNYLKPDEVEVNTPLRPCAVAALAKEEIFKIKNDFIHACAGVDVISVYDERPAGKSVPLSDKDTLRRRGKIK